MKKSIVIASTALVAISLAACSNQSSSSKNTSDNVKTAKKVAASSSKPQTDKFNNNEYGVMGYLMLSQTDAFATDVVPKVTPKNKIGAVTHIFPDLYSL